MRLRGMKELLEGIVDPLRSRKWNGFQCGQNFLGCLFALLGQVLTVQAENLNSDLGSFRVTVSALVAGIKKERLFR